MMPIHLNATVERLQGPTPEQILVGNQWAAVALGRYHTGGSAIFEFELDGIRRSTRIAWDTEFSTATMRERKDMANHGAVALAMFVMAVLLEYQYVEQSEIGEGVDYQFMEKAPADDDLNFLQGGHHVEVSGIMEENGSNTLVGRIRDKQQQIRDGKRKVSGQASVIVTLFQQPKTVKEVHR
jgi:hypothetical protein